MNVELPGRLGVQRRRLGQPAGAGDAAVLEAQTTKQGITAAITVGLLASLTWLLLSAPAYQYVYSSTPKGAWPRSASRGW